MTTEQAKEKLIKTAQKYIGTHESGDNNTPFTTGDWDNKLYGWDLTGQPWCDVFVDYCFIDTFGFDNGVDMTYQYTGCSGAACRYSANYYQTAGAYYQYPEIGDQIFFYYSGDINHTGIVETVSGEGSNWTQITTIEGNSSDMVKRNTYNKGNSVIAGFGRPKWSIVSDGKVEDTTEEETTIEDNAQEQIENATEYTFKTGDLVAISCNAVYYSGVRIPTWVKNMRWYVSSVYGSRVVINKNEEGTRFINSPIDAKYLTLVEESTEDSQFQAINIRPGTVIINSPKDTENLIYTVQRGDTLWGIANTQLGDGNRYKEIISLNNLSSTVIYPGQTLKLPN